MLTPKSRRWLIAGLLLAVSGCDGDAAGPGSDAPLGPFGAWSLAMNAEHVAGTHPQFNTPQMDGCPFVSADGKVFFMASMRDGGLGGIDIWMARRNSPDDPWGEPFNVGAPVNSTANDFCPTLAQDGETFYFASTREGGCGGSDLYVSRLRAGDIFDAPVHLGCEVNSPADEQSPFPLQLGSGDVVLYFSSFRPGGFSSDPEGAVSGDSDIYMSESSGGAFAAAQLVPGLNTEASDGHPNVRRDGLEIFFFSARPGGLGGPDIYSAVRATASGAWSAPVNLGASVNSAGGETRPSLSHDGLTLYFGSDRTGGEGSADIFVVTRNTESN